MVQSKWNCILIYLLKTMFWSIDSCSNTFLAFGWFINGTLLICTAFDITTIHSSCGWHWIRLRNIKKTSAHTHKIKYTRFFRLNSLFLFITWWTLVSIATGTLWTGFWSSTWFRIAKVWTTNTTHCRAFAILQTFWCARCHLRW